MGQIGPATQSSVPTPEDSAAEITQRPRCSVSDLAGEAVPLQLRRSVVIAERTGPDRLLRAKAEASRLVAEGGSRYSRAFLVGTGITEILALTERARQIDPNCLEARAFRGGPLHDRALYSHSPMEAWPDAVREFDAILDIDPADRAALDHRAGAMMARGWDWEWLDDHAQREQFWLPEPDRSSVVPAGLGWSPEGERESTSDSSLRGPGERGPESRQGRQK